MRTTTNVAAGAVTTVDWLAETSAAIVVPVYQREYRWELAACEQLLDDIRAIADAPEGETHFLGSVLSSVSDPSHTTNAAGPGEHGPREPELVLIDGQQRTTTLMLLVAALRDTVGDPQLRARLTQMLMDPNHPGATKLRPNRHWLGVFERIVAPTTPADESPSADQQTHPATPTTAPSQFTENYTFFRREVAREPERIWRGLQRLEHVAITLGPVANAQQIFESLNSTGTPLRDHELIHNYVHMGLSHGEQAEIEDGTWAPIERATGEGIDEFWRHYLVIRSGVATRAEPRAVYDAFRAQFPRLGIDELRHHIGEWLEYAEIFRDIVEPARVADPALAVRLRSLAAFGRTMAPIAMLAIRAHRRGEVDRAQLDRVLLLAESLLLRRAVVGTRRRGLVAPLVRAWSAGPDALERAFARMMPSDLRVRLDLRYRPLPHAEQVLARLQDVETNAELEHVFPAGPDADWSGDGQRTWAELSEAERNSLKLLLPTLGNLTLLEPELRDAAGSRAFLDKRAVYARSTIPTTAALAALPAWGDAAITERTAALGDAFVTAWPRPDVAGIDDDGLTPILDALERPGWYPGWAEEFDKVQWGRYNWDIRSVPDLYRRVFSELWPDHREAILDYSLRHRGPVFRTEERWASTWSALDDGHWLLLAMHPEQQLRATKGLLTELGLADEVLVQYAYGMG